MCFLDKQEEKKIRPRLNEEEMRGVFFLFDQKYRRKFSVCRSEKKKKQ